MEKLKKTFRPQFWPEKFFSYTKKKKKTTTCIIVRPIARIICMVNMLHVNSVILEALL